MSHYMPPFEDETKVSITATGTRDIGQCELYTINHKCKTENYYGYSITSDDTKSLLEALSSAGLQGINITTITARSCGVAFLDNLDDILPRLKQTMAHVKLLTLDTDLVTLDAFTMKNGELAYLAAAAARREALRSAILKGLLGKFLAMTPVMEELVINLRCHESSNMWIDESDLDGILGIKVWPHLQRLELRGVYASEYQLFDLIRRHQKTLQYLVLSDITLKQGSWHSFFQSIRMTLSDSLLSCTSFQLAGSLYFREAFSDETLCWDLSSSNALGRTLGQALIDSVFRSCESSLPIELEQFVDLAICSSAGGEIDTV